MTRTILDLYHATLDNSGGTFDPLSLSDVTTGYAVGLVDGTFRVVSRYQEFAIAIADLSAAYPRAYIGTWLDNDGVHIDPAVVLDNEPDAIALATRNRQRAYYIIHEQREVRL